MLKIENGVVSPTIFNQRPDEVVGQTPKRGDVPIGVVYHLWQGLSVPEDVGFDLPFPERAVQVTEQCPILLAGRAPIRPKHSAETLTETPPVFEPQTLQAVLRK